jgi:hypothetical protein
MEMNYPDYLTDVVEAVLEAVYINSKPDAGPIASIFEALPAIPQKHIPVEGCKTRRCD